MALEQLQRAIKRQESVRRSRDLASALFVVFLIASIGAWATVVLGADGYSLSTLASVLIAILLSGIAIQLLRTALRLGSLLKDPERLLKLTTHERLRVSAWANFLPWSTWPD